MKYRELTIINRGYTVESIDGLDNVGEQAFTHLGYEYPDLSGLDVYFSSESGDAESDKLMLIAYVGMLEQGTEIAEQDVLTRLKSVYGWPDDTVMVDGVPTIPDTA